MLDYESLLITGGGALQIRTNGHCYVGGIYTFGLDDYSTLNFYGGEMADFIIYDHAAATFSGGRIDYISSFQDSDAMKHITN